jgi:heme/copper-type cytochrome/quinol oxidase subunit 4
MRTSEETRGGLTTYLLVYVFILIIAALQILVAYRSTNAEQELVTMLALAIVQAALAVTFFMHMKSEKRNLALFLLPATVFVLAMMNMIWSDSFRLLNMRPFAH